MSKCQTAILFLLLTFLPACHLISAPLTVPQAIAKNADFHLTANVVDPDGKPLDNVIVTQELHHYFWSATSSSGTTTNEPTTRLLNGPFAVNERGASLTLHFSRNGYYDQMCTLLADAPNQIGIDHLLQDRHQSGGSFILTPNFPIVMIPRISSNSADPDLLHGSVNFFYQEPTRMWALALPTPATRNRNLLVDLTHPETIPANTLYLTITDAKSTPADSHGIVDPIDINLPDAVTLQFAGADATTGFQLIPPRNGFHPMRTANSAPTSGYQPTLVIPRARLREMRPNERTLLQAYEFFYVRVDNRYGKGFLTWNLHYDPVKKNIEKATFILQILLQPTPNDPNLMWRSNW